MSRSRRGVRVEDDDDDEGPKVEPVPTIEKWKRSMKHRPKLPHLIEDIHPDAPGEYSIISGRTGIGKTNLQLHMAFSLATGTPFFGKHCEKVGVSMLAFEGPEDNVFERVKKVEKHYPPPEGRLHFEFLPMESPKRLFEHVVLKLTATDKCKVVILDAVRYIVAGEYLKPSDVAPFVQGLKQVLHELELSAIIALPISKPKNRGQLIDPEDVYSIKGCTEWVDPAITVMVLEKRMRRPMEHLTLGFAKCRIAENGRPKSINLFYDHELCLFTPEQETIESDGGVLINSALVSAALES